MELEVLLKKAKDNTLLHSVCRIETCLQTSERFWNSLVGSWIWILDLCRGREIFKFSPFNLRVIRSSVSELEFVRSSLTFSQLFARQEECVARSCKLWRSRYYKQYYSWEDPPMHLSEEEVVDSQRDDWLYSLQHICVAILWAILSNVGLQCKISLFFHWLASRPCGAICQSFTLACR